MDMTYDHASNIVKHFGKGNLLTGLKWMKLEMATVDDKGYPIWLTNAQVAAYRIVMNEMRQLVG